MKAMRKCILVLLLWPAFGLTATTTVTHIAAGGDDSFFLKSDGSLWDMGYNGNGQLGDGSYSSINEPEQIVPSNVSEIAAGGGHSLFVKSDGSLWGMGYNGNGQLGIASGYHSPFYSDVTTPQLVMSSGVTAIATGSSYSLVLKFDGSLWVMGGNACGQLGDGTTNDTDVPEQIVSGGVVAVSAGVYHSLLLKSDGSLWGMGNNHWGELGNGTTSNALVPVEIVSGGVIAIAAGGLHSLFVKSDGSLWGMGYNGLGELGDGATSKALIPVEIVSSGVVAVSAGDFHSLFLKSDGSLWGMGVSFGSLPEQIVASNVVSIAAGENHSLFIKSDGSLWAVGDNISGELGDGFASDSLVPEQVVPTPPPVLAPPVFWGATAVTAVTNIAAGVGYSMFVKADGSLWAMGDNSSGELGDGTTNQTVFSPEQIASGVIAVSAQRSAQVGDAPNANDTLVLQTNDSYWATGRGGFGDGTTYDNTNRLEQILSNGVEAVAAGPKHTLLLKIGGSLWGMGLNDVGQLGLSTLTIATNWPALIVSNGVAAIAAGDQFSMFIKTNGSLWGMGASFGRLPEQIVASNVVAVAAGSYHSLCLKSDGSLWARGDNEYGQLGDGTNGFTTILVEVVSNGVTAIAAGSYDSFFLKSDGSLWGMGYNGLGELGDCTFSNADRPEEIAAGGVTAVAASQTHTLFLKSDGTLWGMGDNRYGELGVVSGGPFPMQLTASPGSLLLQGNCLARGTYYLLGSTNLTQPLNQWTRVLTNFVSIRKANNFAVITTNAVNSNAGREFYILQSQ